MNSLSSLPDAAPWQWGLDAEGVPPFVARRSRLTSGASLSNGWIARDAEDVYHATPKGRELLDPPTG